MQRIKTRIVIKEGWRLIMEYDYLVTMSTGDTVEWEDKEYTVDSCLLEIKTFTMIILLDN